MFPISNFKSGIVDPSIKINFLKNEHNKYIYSVNDIYKIIFEFDDDFCIVRNSNYVDSYYTVIKFKKESELNISINEYSIYSDNKIILTVKFIPNMDIIHGEAVQKSGIIELEIPDVKATFQCEYEFKIYCLDNLDNNTILKLDCLFKYSNEYWNENERKLKCKVDVCIYKTKQLIKKYNVDFTEFSIR